MALNKYLQKAWLSEESQELMKKRLIDWRKEHTVTRIDNPTRLDRAHALGYKAKQGFILVRTKIKKGTRKREDRKGKKPLRQGMTGMSPAQNHMHIAEVRVAKKYPNLEVLNSYYVAEDGRQKWYEVILIDPMHPCIMNDSNYNWSSNPANRRRAFRGLTSAGRHSRMLGKGKGFERKGTIKSK